MRMRHKKWAIPELKNSDFYISDPEKYINKWKKQFKNTTSPLHIELGCGKGVFSANFAYIFPNVNLLAIDISTDVLGVCARNIKEAFSESERNADNIFITNYNVEKINNILGPNDHVERIYINFCNPWPKVKHKKRRLTHITKLEKYKCFLEKGAKIYFKTDDNGLFRDSLKYFEQKKFNINRLSYDLHNEYYKDTEPKIMTEHEQMFTKEGIKIKFLEAECQ